MMAARRYFSDSKPVLLGLIDPRGLRILDAGCAGGGNGKLMKDAGAREVVGIELDGWAAREAGAVLDAVYTADIATIDLGILGPDPFDAILCIDVLEHLVDPAFALRRLLTVLKPGGRVVACIPNVAHVWVIANLLAGRWPQKDAGIFDRTHLRFFARRDMIRLLESTGLRVVRVEPYFTRYRLIRWVSLALSLYVFRAYWARQFLLVAEKPLSVPVDESAAAPAPRLARPEAT
jgi:2-polyprenyl-3-methyl-5-hydroxy-6-metoxy-1,4-benzoquinol methylase